MGEKWNACRLLVGKLEWRQLGIPKRRWQNNNKRDFRQIGWSVMDSIYLAQDMNQWNALVNTVMNIWVP
jgi:hypothetical protein